MEITGKKAAVLAAEWHCARSYGLLPNSSRSLLTSAGLPAALYMLLMPDAIPAEVHHLLSQHIRSVAQLELLLLHYRAPERSWSVEEAAKALYTAVSMTEPLLESLRTAGMLGFAAGEGKRYRYSPKSEDIGRAVEQLAKLYQERPVTIITILYAAPADELRNFADAFRIRKKEEN